jgi:hypothetical protein
MAYLPRAVDHPEGGWKLGERYGLHPDSEQRALEGTLPLIR